MTDLLVYTLDEMAEAKREAFESGWHEGFRAGVNVFRDSPIEAIQSNE